MGNHRRENGGITVRALSDRCEWGVKSFHVYCTLKAGHNGGHILAHPGTQGPAVWYTVGALEVS